MKQRLKLNKQFTVLLVVVFMMLLFPMSVFAADATLPWVNIVEDYRTDGTLVVYIIAKDEESGLNYIQTPDGVKKYLDGTTQRISVMYPITNAGTYIFYVVDKAGNTVTKTYNYVPNKPDTAVSGFKAVTAPATQSDFTVEATWHNKNNIPQDALIEFYAVKGSTTTTLYSSRLSLSGNTSITKSYTLQAQNLSGNYTLYARINGDRLQFETNPVDNVASVSIGVSAYDISLTVPQSDLESVIPGYGVRPGQTVKVPIVLRGNNLGDNMDVPVQVFIDGSLYSTTSYNMGRYQTEVRANISIEIPSTTGHFNIKVIANPVRVSEETNTSNNEYTFDVTCAKGTSADFDLTLKDTVGILYQPTISANDITYYLPTDFSGNVTMGVTMKDKLAQVKTLAGQAFNTDVASKTVQVSPSSVETYSLTVSAQDSTIVRTYNIHIVTENSSPIVTIANKDEVTGNRYSVGGVLTGSGHFTPNVFLPYGDSITKVDAAQRAGRTSGVILKIDVTDPDVSQFLGGYATLSGIKYPIRWNSFDGPTRIQANLIQAGYIYIDHGAFTADLVDREIVISVQDYKTAQDAETSALSDVVIAGQLFIGADITPPTILNTSAAVGDNPPILVDTTDTWNGMAGRTNIQDFQYRLSTNSGIAWGAWEDVPDAGGIVVTLPGTVYVEVRARDKTFNARTLLVIVTNSGGSTGPDETDAESIYSVKTRAADFIYVNSRRNNATGIANEALDAFK